MSRNTKSVPEAKAALDQFKYEVASEIGVPLKKGYNGDLTSAQNGSVGGYMVNIMSPQRHLVFERQKGMKNWAESRVCYTYAISFT